MMKEKTFQQRVLAIVAAIPKGEAMSYQQVASLAGNPGASRAVGNIMSRNRDSKVPCHRVVRTDGTFGNYAFGGRQRKIEILAAEGYGPAEHLI